MITGCVGPEGAGKSALMTYLDLIHLARGGSVYAFPGYRVTDGHGNELSKPIEISEWALLPDWLRDCVISVDEIQNFFGSDRFMAWMNKLWASIVAQRRHRNLGINYTVQDWEDLDPRVRKKTHILAVCRDLYWSRWGKEEGVGRGELIRVNFIDVKGFFTGVPWTPGPSKLIRMRPVWDHYESYGEVDIWSGMARVKFKKPEYLIDLTGSGGEEEPPSGAGGSHKEKGKITNDDLTLLTDLANTPGIDPSAFRKLQTKLHRLAELENDEGGMEAS
jgi:hypothetical protein